MKRKYELNLYAPFQYEDIQDHLEEMAERGWELEKASHRLFVYQAAEPGPVRYALAYRPEVGWMDQLPTQGQEIYAGYCQDAGWELVDTWARYPQIQIYRSRMRYPVPLETDLTTHWQVLTTWMERRYVEPLRSYVAIGSLIGEILDIDGHFKRLTNRFSSGNSLAQGLSTGILLFCVGTLSILGPIQSALYGDNTYLFTNATLDLVTSTVLASTYGIGMILAAPVLFLFQGTIYMITSFAGDVISDSLMCEISIVGGVLIASSGLSILGIKDCKTLNMLPALLVPVLFYVVKSLF